MKQAGADPGFDKGVDHGQHGARAHNPGLGLEPPAGSRGKVPPGGQRGEAPLKLKAFSQSSYKRGAKR